MTSQDGFDLHLSNLDFGKMLTFSCGYLLSVYLPSLGKRLYILFANFLVGYFFNVEVS